MARTTRAAISPTPVTDSASDIRPFLGGSDGDGLMARLHRLTCRFAGARHRDGHLFHFSSRCRVVTTPAYLVVRLDVEANSAAGLGDVDTRRACVRACVHERIASSLDRRKCILEVEYTRDGQQLLNVCIKRG